MAGRGPAGVSGAVEQPQSASAARRPSLLVMPAIISIHPGDLEAPPGEHLADRLRAGEMSGADREQDRSRLLQALLQPAGPGPVATGQECLEQSRREIV